MGLLRIVAAGALSYLGYRAWQRHQDDKRPPPAPLIDDTERTAPHGDPLMPRVSHDAPAAAPAGAQSSRGFGGV